MFLKAAEKAYELSQRVSEAERFYVLKRYYFDVTGELEKDKEVVTLWMQNYPRASFPP